MRIGFAKVDITPRVGVELTGFGPFRNRKSIGIRDRLWARAMAVEVDGRRVVVISCDLLGFALSASERVWDIVGRAHGLQPSEVIITCTHTHSGPNTKPGIIGWGAYDPPYAELLPRRVAAAVAGAIADMAEAELRHAEVPCQGIGLNRERDRDAPPLDEVLSEDWRPAKPEFTDTTCHVLSVFRRGQLRGFVSYFSCHPVVCCAANRYIHGDFVGVATNMLEREHSDCVGLFLLGAHGDINSCVVHKDEQESLLALDVIASRYARAVRSGLASGTSLAVDAVAGVQSEVDFSRRDWTIDDVRQRIAQEQALLDAATSDDDAAYRLAVVRQMGLQRILEHLQSGADLAQPVALHGIRIGPVAILGSPFETFRQIKNDVLAKARSPLALVVSMADDSKGYAPDEFALTRGGYAADQVPLMYGIAPFARLYDELPAALLKLEGRLLAGR